MPKFIARVHMLERHPDGSTRQFTITRIVDDKTPVGELFQWRSRKVHDPLNGEYASSEIVLTPDHAEEDYG